MNEIFRLYNGREVGTGCLIPSKRPETLQAFADVVPILTKDEIGKILQNSKRKMGRNRFGPEFIGYQGNIGSCNGYAGAKALERVRVLHGHKWVKLSGEGLYAQINGGVDMGSGLDEGMHCLLDNGVPPEELVPFFEYRKRKISDEAWKAASRFKALEAYRVDTEEELATGLALNYIGVVAVHAGGQFQKLDGDGVVYQTFGLPNHAVGTDDVRIFDNEYQFDMFNSWSTDYGDNGRGWLTWKKHLSQSSKMAAFYLIRSVVRDDEGNNPPKLK